MKNKEEKPRVSNSIPARLLIRIPRKWLLVGLTITALLFIIPGKAHAAVSVPGGPGGPPSPVNTAYFDGSVALGNAIACGDGTYTRYLKHFSAPDLDDAGGYYVSHTKNINLTGWSGYYVCPGTSYRYNSSQHIVFAIAPGMKTKADMAAAGGWDRGTQVLGGTVNSGSGSWWLQWGIGPTGLAPGWNTISLNFQPDTCTTLPSGTCSPIASISPNISYIYYNPGVQDAANCNAISGWAFDSDNWWTSINVDMYDGQAGAGGTPIGRYPTNVLRNDVNAFFGISGNHGYSIATPAVLKDGNVHQIYMYAIGVDGAGNIDGGNWMLANSPITIGPCVKKPVGTIDTADCTSITGWVYDPDNTSKSLDINIWNGPPGSPSTLLQTLSANVPRPDVNAALGITGNHGFNIDPRTIPGLDLSRTNTIYIAAYGVDAAGNRDGSDAILGKGAQLAQSIGPCGTTSANFTLSPTAQLPGLDNDEAPSVIQFNTSYVTGSGIPAAGVQATATRTYFWKRGGVRQVPDLRPAAATTQKFTNAQFTFADPPLTVPPPNLQAGDEVCIGLTINPGGGSVDGAGNVTSPTPAKYSEACVRLANKPYVSFFGNDVLAGARFAGPSGCSGAVPSSNIKAFNRGGAGSPGAGNQLGVFAVGSIDQFASAALRTTAPTPATGLTFANSPPSTWGGNFGTSTCLPDYFASATSPQPNNYRVSPAAKTVMANPAGNPEIIYVNGDAIIDNNIVYANAGTWSAQNQIPSFYLIVKGNIYISQNVSQLDGVYIAQPTGSSNTGQIYTCANTLAKSLYPMSQLYTLCNRQLTVNGSFIASQVKLLRTFGSLRDSVTPPGRPAEVFRFSPETYLTSGPVPTGTTSIKKYDYVTSLPPVL